MARARTSTVCACLIYFAMVFGAGFALGIVRTLWLAPAIGDRAAELIEAPLMLAITVLAARFIAARTPNGALIAVGIIAACLVISFDVVVGVALRDMSIREIFVDRDIVAGTVYYLLIGVFAAAPYFAAKLQRQNKELP